MRAKIRTMRLESSSKNGLNDSMHSVPGSENSGKIKITHFVSNGRYLGNGKYQNHQFRPSNQEDEFICVTFSILAIFIAEITHFWCQKGNFDFPRVFALGNAVKSCELF